MAGVVKLLACKATVSS